MNLELNLQVSSQNNGLLIIAHEKLSTVVVTDHTDSHMLCSYKYLTAQTHCNYLTSKVRSIREGSPQHMIVSQQVP